MNTTQNLKDQMTATARAFESILTAKMSFGSLVQARRIYMDKLNGFKAQTQDATVQARLTEALSDVSTSASPRLVLLATEAL